MVTKTKRPVSAAAVEPVSGVVSEVMETVQPNGDRAADSLARGWTAFAGLNIDEIADISRKNLVALTQSNLALADGLQAITEEVLGYARSAVTNAGHTASALLAARTLDEVVQINTELAKSSIETLFTQSAKLSEIGVTVASETLAPLGGRVEATFARLTRPAA